MENLGIEPGNEKPAGAAADVVLTGAGATAKKKKQKQKQKTH